MQDALQRIKWIIIAVGEKIKVVDNYELENDFSIICYLLNSEPLIFSLLGCILYPALFIIRFQCSEAQGPLIYVYTEVSLIILYTQNYSQGFSSPMLSLFLSISLSLSQHGIKSLLKTFSVIPYCQCKFI